MKVKIHVELITDWGESTTVETCEFTRPMREFSAETVGLSLDDGVGFPSICHFCLLHLALASFLSGRGHRGMPGACR